METLRGPRRLLGLPDGAAVVLLAVEVADGVTLTLSATGPAAAEASARYQEAHDAWAVRVRAAQDAGRRDPVERPPRRPADDLSDLRLDLSDDVGTLYAWVTGMAGHEDDPWRYVLELQPTPPPDATTLRISLDGGEEVVVGLPPWDGR